jgi:peptide/nickel transport system substrate-binding protein
MTRRKHGTTISLHRPLFAPRSARPNRSIHLLFIPALLLFLSACAPVHIPTSDVTPAPTELPSPTSLPATPVEAATTSNAPETPLPEGGTIVIGAVGNGNFEVNTLPAFLQSALYDSLLRPNPATGALEPGLAEAWQVSDDATTITFRLRLNLLWSNGDRVTANDVVATINAFSGADFRGTPITDFGTLAGVTAPDDRTVRLVLREPYCPALTSVGTMAILPRAAATSSNFPHLTPEQWIGTGPLKLRSSNNDQFVLVPNDLYYRGTAHIAGWTLRLFPDAASLRAAIAAKQVDVVAVAPTEYNAMKKLDGLTVLPANAPLLVTLLLNYESVALNDGRVRQALAYAIDRPVLLDDLGGHAELVDGSVLPGYWARPANPPRFPLDPARSKQLLSDAGWRGSGNGVVSKDGQPLKLDLWTEADDPILEPLAFRLREMLAPVGIQVQLQLDDRPGWVTRAFQHRFDMLLLERKIPLDPDQRWYWQTDQNAQGSGFNFGSYASGRVDALLKESLRARGCDAGARAGLLGEINQNLITDAPAVFLLTPKKYLVTRDRVLNPYPSTFAGDFWNLNEWRVKP